MELLGKTVKAIRPVKDEWYDIAQKRLDNLTKPPGSLGRLEEFARRLVAIAENRRPVLDKKAIFTFAGDHGIVDEGVSAYPKEVTPQMVLNIVGGGAAISVLSRHAGAQVVVVDIGVDHEFGQIDGLLGRKVMRGTRNFAHGPAMTRKEAIACIECGIELAEEYVRKGYKILGTGEMGIGNTTPSSAIAAVLTGSPVAEVTGRGTGISDDALIRKTRVIEDAIRLNKPDPKDAIDVLSRWGARRSAGSPDSCSGPRPKGYQSSSTASSRRQGRSLLTPSSLRQRTICSPPTIPSRRAIASLSRPWASPLSSISG